MENDQDRHDLAESVILTTETPRGIAERVLILLVFGGFAVAFTILFMVGEPGRERRIDDRDAIFGLGGLQSLVFGLGLLGTQLIYQGTWILRDEGISFQPSHRRRRTLSWSSIERVQWHKAYAEFRAGSTVIHIPWAMFSEHQRLAALALIEARLSPRFDLKDLVDGPAPLPSMTRMMAIGLSIFIPWAGLMCAGVSLLPVQTWRWVAPTLGGLTTVYFGGLFAFGWLLVCRDRKSALEPARRIHPAWPWRLPREKSRELAGSKTDQASWLDEP